MAYYSGTASSLADLRTALLTHAQADGWVLTGDVLSKAGVYFQIQVTADNITCLGCESNAVLNPAPGVVMIGKIFAGGGVNPPRLISFPCNYEVFGFTQELYLVANYGVDTYQWMAFGKTSVPGIPGQGGWCGATQGSAIYGSNVITDAIGIGLSLSGNYYHSTAALFWGTSGYWDPSRNCWVNSGLDLHGWKYGAAVDTVAIGVKHQNTLIGLQPSVWNSESTLLPLRCCKERPSFKISLTVDLANARHIRIDNFTPGDILTLGADKWKVFPWYRKDGVARNGGSNINHTGTFGWAIRYEP